MQHELQYHGHQQIYLMLFSFAKRYDKWNKNVFEESNLPHEITRPCKFEIDTYRFQRERQEPEIGHDAANKT